MHKILDNVTDYSWWFGVVFIGIILNLITSYLKPAIDKQWAKYSSRKRENLSKKAQRINEIVELLNSSEEERRMIKFRMTEYRVDANHSLIFSISFLAFAFAAIQMSSTENIKGWFLTFLLLASLYFLFESFYLRARARGLDTFLSKTNFPNRW